MTIFANATVIDGTSKARFTADVAVEEDTIREVSLPGTIKTQAELIDCTGKILCPGFMDIHAHSELEVLRNPSMPHKIQQGITTDVSGNCGVGVWPRRKQDKPVFADILGHCDNWYWSDFESYSEHLNSGINMGFLQNHAMLRMMAIDGNPNRPATQSEVATMCELLDTALSQGCLGLSSGLYYAPNIYADRNELVQLLKVVRKHNTLFTVHHRCEGTEILSSLDEVFSLVRETGVRLEISHLKTIGIKNAPKADTALRMIHKMRDEGFEVAFDQYPYGYGSTSLFSLLPPELLKLEMPQLRAELARLVEHPDEMAEVVHQMKNPQGWDSITELCGFDNITAVTLEDSPQYSGLTLSQCSRKMGKDPYTTLFTLLSRETGCALMIDTTQSEETLEMVMKDPLMCFGTDALYASDAAHPRSGNAAIHLLDRYCLTRKTLSLEEGINRMTMRVAERLGINDRGCIRPGCRADIIVFDPETLKDNSSPADPYRPCSGLEHVMVNGQFALKDSNLTGTTSGQIIR